MIKSILKLGLCVAGLGVILARPAVSATFDFSTTLPKPIDMLQASSIKDGQDGGQVRERITVTDGVDSKFLSPWFETAYWEGGLGPEYTAVGKGASAAYEFSDLYSSVSFLWGSVDEKQQVRFFQGDEPVYVLNSDLLLKNGAPEKTGFVQITIFTQPFNRIEFYSQNNSFEFANLRVSAVPLPAALPLYAAGLLVLGLIGRFRKFAK
ncbi:VPLPA-CTERM sorting domain-containing protein [Sneathiella limimaris]|uniref:VPLPA-CTERM sorting domain-containing protein n=1 Tax=Sneathiella limimaris TaxID=1964213 RepID=UPI00146C2893|nr:VPLPA-CTERM sorting domain-containing protein [Sneathiella limimaris]